jgi:hypothetical protein
MLRGRSPIEDAGAAGLGLLRSSPAAKSLQPLLNGRRRIFHASGRELSRPIFHDLIGWVRGSLHPAFLEDTLGRACEPDLRRHGKGLLPDLSAWSPVRPFALSAPWANSVRRPSAGQAARGSWARLRTTSAGHNLARPVTGVISRGRTNGRSWLVIARLGLIILVLCERAIAVSGGGWRPSFEVHCLF